MAANRPQPPPDPRGREDDAVRALAGKWMRTVAASAYVPMSARELEDYLHELVVTLTGALAARPFDVAPGVDVGKRMVACGLIGIGTLERSVDLLVGGLLDLTGPLDATGLRNMTSLFAAVSTGYAEAVRRRTLDQQEDMKRALLAAKQRAERVMRATESRFREVFASSPIGIAITDQAGRFVDVNPALVEILASQPERLVGRSLTDYLADGESGGPLYPPRGRLQLMRDDGDTAWVYVAISPLREGPGEPESYVTTVHDLSELQLLQGRFGHQLLHDALTGLANRLHFESALEARLGQAEPGASVTLCCVDLDAFSVLNDGLGHEAGDRLLRTVAKRIEEAVNGEQALVARTDGDEFAILVEDSPTTPDIPELVGRINEALAEPEYLDGHGVALSATIGVVRCLATERSGKELFRAAGVALRAARGTGRGQWMRFDPEYDARVRRIQRDAVALPGAFETGELEVGYEPVVRLADRTTVAVRAALRWTGRASGPFDEAETMRLAELTGQSVLLGPWLLRTACENLPPWQRTGPDRDSVLRVRLSRAQSADDDLVGAVLRATEAARLQPHLLELSFDTSAVLEEFGSAPDNLQVIAEIGIRTALSGFTGGPRELALLERSSARSVLLADPFLAGGDEDAPAMPPAVELLVISIKELGAMVSVGGVRTEREANLWASVGVDTAEGPAFGDAADAGDAEEVSTRTGRAAQ